MSESPHPVVQRDETVPRPRGFLVRRVAPVAASAVVTAALATLPAAPAPAAAHTTYLVRQHDRGCSDSGRGTARRPFCSISAAAAVADAGDTVRVGAGTYREQVTAPSGVTFVAPRKSARLVGSDSFASAPGAGGAVEASARTYGFLIRGVHDVTDPGRSVQHRELGVLRQVDEGVRHV